MIPARAVEKRIRIAAALLLLGVAIEALTLSVLHPLAFIAFASLGALLVAAGVIMFLLTLLGAGEAAGAGPS
jgi:hypothetical protein